MTRAQAFGDDALTSWKVAQEAERRGWEALSWQRMSRQTRLAEWTRHLAELGVSINDFTDKQVLDVGCGPTGIVYFLTARRLVGLDPLGRSYEKWNGFFGRRIELVEGMAESMPFRNQVFDAVFCINCIDHSYDPAAILAECARVVKPGGMLIFHVDIDSPLRKLHKKVSKQCGLAHPQSISYSWLKDQLGPQFIVAKEWRDPEVFRATMRQMKYEAYWDGLLYRLTKARTWMNHVWLLASRR